MMTLAAERRRVRNWLARPAIYTVGAPVFTVLGAATTVLAPRLLEPVQFGRFILLASLFQYVADFDLGLSRLTDRALALPPGERPDCSIGELLWARLWVAAAVWLVIVAVCWFLAGAWGPLALVASSGGLAFMLSNGPVAAYRAGGRISEFTVSALSMQFGLGLPRLAGLLLAGVEGCFLGLVGWYVLTTAVFAAVFTPRLTTSPAASRVLRLVGSGLPLFTFGTLWSLYLLANRWIASLLVAPAQTGLFGFGVTLVTVGVGVVGTISQVHYPKHLARTGTSSLPRETERLLALAALGVMAGVWACRFMLPMMFPHFVDAAPAAAALLLSGIPLALCSWLLPLAVATTTRPWREAPAIFGASLIVLVTGMIVGRMVGSITALAWGCLPSSVLLLGIFGHRLMHAGLLSRAALRSVLLLTAVAMIAGGLEWLILFR